MFCELELVDGLFSLVDALDDVLLRPDLSFLEDNFPGLGGCFNPAPDRADSAAYGSANCGKFRPDACSRAK